LNKQKRHTIILSCIGKNKFSSQEELLQYLNEKKIQITQATLSRDLKELMVSRIFDAEKGMIYVSPLANVSSDREFQPKNKTIVSIDFSGNIFVIKTLPGYASAIALQLDQLKHNVLLGTIAGDDTIFAVCKPNTKPSLIKQIIQTLV